MALQKTLSIALALAAVPAFGAQDPGLDLQVAAPQLSGIHAPSGAKTPQFTTQTDPMSPSAPSVFGQIPEPATGAVIGGMPSVTAPAQTFGSPELPTSQRISMSFSHSSVADVLQVLQRQGVSFVVDDNLIPKDRTITLNIEEQPVSEVIEAIGAALGGHFARHGNIYVFETGPMQMLYGAPGASFQYRAGGPAPIMPNIQELQKQLRMAPPSYSMRIDGNALKMPAGGWTLRGGDFVFVRGGLTDLVKTLTREQRDLAKRRGYLTPKDLTPSQRRYLPQSANGTYFIKITENGQTYTFKNR